MGNATATLAGGCFWCTEAIFQRLNGVSAVTPGYTAGKRENPSYEQISTGATGHAEAIQVTFDPKRISYEKLLEIFFATHDPTTKDRQGADVGTQYRSAIFYHTESQKSKAQKMISKLNSSNKYDTPIVTEVVPFQRFYTAENYHHNYYNDNRAKNPYCRVIIDPKVKKLLSEYSTAVREEYKG